MWASRLRQLGVASRTVVPVLGSSILGGSFGRPARCEEQAAEFASGAANDNPLHTLMHNLSESLQSQTPGQVVGTLEGTGGKAKVVRVVLTGGPCAGKTSCLEHISKEATRAGFDVIQCPEIATVVLNSGFRLPSPDSANFAEQIWNFQLAIAKMQLQIERNLLSLAQGTGTPTIMVFDRGILDGKAYMLDDDGKIDEDKWARLTSELETGKGASVDDAYFLERYDCVVHLATTAEDGVTDTSGKPVYRSGWTRDDSGHAVYRRETPEQAREIDARVRSVWCKHKRFSVVKNTTSGMDAKVRAAVEAIMEVAEEIHPQQVTPNILRRRMRELSLENAQLVRRLSKLEADSVR